MTATMSISKAIRTAKSQVVLVGPMAQTLPGGYAAYRVNAYDAGYEAWVQGRDTDYATARQQARNEVVVRALVLLGWEAWDVERAEANAWEWKGSAESVVRSLVEG